MTSSDLEKIEKLIQDLKALEEGQAERDRLREESHASLERLHRLVREMDEAEPGGARAKRR